MQPGHVRVSGRSDGCSYTCSVWLRPVVRASGRLSRPKGAVRCHKPGEGGCTRTQRKTPEQVDKLLHHVRPLFSNCADSPPRAHACRSNLHLSADRDCARSLPRRSWDLLELLVVLSVISAGCSSRSRCSTSCDDSERTRGALRLLRAPAGIESRLQITDRDRSPPKLLTCSHQPCSIRPHHHCLM